MSSLSLVAVEHYLAMAVALLLGEAGLGLVGSGCLAWKRGWAMLAIVLIAFGTVGAGVAAGHISSIFQGA